MEDNEILKLIRNGDIDTYALIVEKYHRSLLNFIYATIGDGRFVEDIGQETFISAFKSISEFDNSRGIPFSAWIFTIAKNKCFSELRKKKRGLHVGIEFADTIHAPESSAEAMVLEQERLQEIDKAIEQVPQPFRSALLDCIQGKTLAQAAREHNVAVGTIKSRLARARSKLKMLLGMKIKGGGGADDAII